MFGNDVLGGGFDEAFVLEEEGVRFYGSSAFGWVFSGFVLVGRDRAVVVSGFLCRGLGARGYR